MSTARNRLLFTACALGIVAATPVQADDFRDNFPAQYTDTPMGVNLQSGRFSYWLFSFAMGPFAVERGFNKGGFPFVASIYWHTVQTATGAGQDVLTVNIGNPGLSLGNTVSLVEVAPRPVSNSWLKGASSTRLDFFPPGSSPTYLWMNTSSVGWKLQRVGSAYVLTDKSGNTYAFEDTALGNYPSPNARLSALTDSDGSAIAITYDTAGRLSFLQSNRGYAVRYEYVNGGAQVKVCGFNLAQTYASASTACSSSTYQVTINNTVRGDGFLQPTSVVDVMGQTSTISWTGNFPLCATLPNSSTCEFTNSYGPQAGEVPQLTKVDQVRVQTDANGNAYTYEYEFPIANSDDPPKLPGGPPVLSTSWMSGPGYGAQANYEDGLAKTVSAPGGGPNTFEYDGVNMKRAIYPEGNDIVITRDYVGNAGTIVEHPKSGSGLSAVTRTQNFPIDNLYANPTICQASSDKLCDKPTSQVDAKGYQTDYTYDPAHGGMLTKTLPAVTQANGATVRPEVRFEYAQRYAWTKNSGGGYSQASSPIWVKTRERSCKTTAASGQTCSGGAADEVITDYEYGPDSGPNNLHLRGVAVTADGPTLRTCYAYDANGRRIGETKAKAGLTVCP